eukprot:6186078-Pleurochrysis_carterae.AAC.1
MMYARTKAVLKLRYVVPVIKNVSRLSSQTQSCRGATFVRAQGYCAQPADTSTNCAASSQKPMTMHLSKASVHVPPHRREISMVTTG